MKKEIRKVKDLIRRVEAAVAERLVVLVKGGEFQDVRNLAEKAQDFQAVKGSLFVSLENLDRYSEGAVARVAKASKGSAKTNRKRKPEVAKPPANARMVRSKSGGAKVSKKTTTPKAKKSVGKKKQTVTKKPRAKLGKKQERLDNDILAILKGGTTKTELVKARLEELGYKNVSGLKINGIRQRGIPKKKKK